MSTLRTISDFRRTGFAFVEDMPAEISKKYAGAGLGTAGLSTATLSAGLLAMRESL